MNKEDVVLAALAASDSVSHTPVQVQKLLFLLDREVPQHIGGPFFDFQPYDYGPFDKGVYHILDDLAQKGMVQIDYTPDLRWRKYQLTKQGADRGLAALGQMRSEVANWIRAASNWVNQQSFAQLVSAIYAKYPEMKEKSVFKD